MHLHAVLQNQPIDFTVRSQTIGADMPLYAEHLMGACRRAMSLFGCGRHGRKQGGGQKDWA
jgi:hypothetical protein